ncbi:MAG TPA: response regulator [Burkholderiales bacterium]|nr:response regulator [Burkholderiales bacterium]
MANILAVDDAATMRQVVNFALTDAGHTVAEASGVDEALARAAKSKFDLVIADLNMPGKNGLELVKALRAMPEFRFAPILMLTTEHRDELKAAGKEAGVTGWLLKPFDPTVLLDVVKKVLK